jgi:hypothetical protein
MKPKKKLCLPRQAPDPRKRIEIELQAKIDARLAAEEQAKLKRAAEVNLPIEEKS